MNREDRRLLVVVGTDFHPFDRLMDWLERWYAHRPDRPDLVVQHGHSRRPDLPGAAGFLDHGTLRSAIATATLVVTHGGPASILETRRAGRLPVVVPRDPRHGEHVDDHQQRFAHWLARADMIRLCDVEADLAGALDAGLADPDAFRLAADPREEAATRHAAARVGRIVEELIGIPGAVR